MNKIYKLTLVIIITFFGLSTIAQKSFFTDISEAQAKSGGGKREIFPQKFRTIAMDVQAMKTFLWSLPDEKTINSTRSNAPVLELPMPDGTMAKFHVWESSVQEPGLAAKFTEIKTFAGQGVDDKYATLRFDYNPYFGLNAQILSAVTGRVFIVPFAKYKINNYISYYTKDHIKNGGFACTTDQLISNTISNRPAGVEAASCRGLQLTTYRLAFTCTGEFAQAVGGGAAGPTHAAIVTGVNRLTQIYEDELAIRLVLIANNNLIEFLNPATDPFLNDGSIAELNSITGAINTALGGSTGYDIGHLGCTASDAGVAGLGVVCSSSKGRGLTGGLNPVGDNYYVDYVAHEMGHQFNAQHTFNTNTCFSSGGSYEPGGGTTIMAYAGICAPTENIAPHSDAIFHAISFDQIINFITSAGGSSCGVTTATTNILPVIAALSNNNINIPINTPFTLIASATDANGDAITYNWEGWDVGAAGSWPSAAASTTRPLFRTRLSKTTGSRTFPDIRVIAANYPGTAAPEVMDGLRGEVLPTVPRTMKFRLTVRDNRAGGGGVVSAGEGCQDATTFQVNAVGTTPFTVTVPNGGESYFTSSTQTVTWNNAATNAAPFNVANVRISFSNDGGLTYPTVLLANTANDGSEVVTMPAIATTTARIRVEAIGNIFFDISNANFTLTVPPTDFNFGTTTATTSACPSAATLSVSIPTTVTGTFTNPITLATTSGVPAGTTVTFAPNPVTPGSNVVATLNNANTLAFGTYTIGVSGTATGASVKNTTITFTINAGTAPVISTQPAANVTVCAPATASFTVASSTAGVTYQWQSALPAGTFSNIVAASAITSTYTTGATNASMNGMQYRCLVSTQCGTTISSIGTLTVNTAAAITIQPTNQSACTGATATFTVTATGTGVAYQWQSGTTASGPWTSVGTNSATYTTPAVTLTTPSFYQVIVTTTTCPGTVTSSPVSMAISATTAIGTQPAPQTVCEGAAANFSVTASGTALSYQWQMATAAAPTTFSNVGANTATYSTGATTVAMNGNIYRVIVTGSCNTITSNTALLNVNTAAAITTQPTPQIVCNGVTATFTAAGSGTGVVYQWQSSTTATGPWASVTGGTGANTVSYTTAVTTPAMNGTFYRLLATTTTCPLVVNSSAVLLTVNTVAIIGTQPAAQTVCIPNTGTFAVAATGTGLTYQWQRALAATPTAFTDITGATSATYTTPIVVIGDNGNLYRVNILSTCSPTTPTTSSSALLTVINPVAVSQNPIAASGCAGDNYTFSVTATPATVNYQWEVSTNGGTSYTAITGATAATLPINGASIMLNGNMYRVVVTGIPCGIITTPGAKLTLSYRPSIVLTAPATSSTNASVNQGLFTTISPSNFVGTFNWTKNGATIPNTLTAASILLPVDGIGTYKVSTKDANTGCVSESNIVVIDAEKADNIAKGKLFIYPNPVTNTMEVRFNFPNVGTLGTVLNIFDEKGAKVFSKAFTLSNTFGRMRVDMSNVRPATYIAYVMDANGNKLASAKVVKVP